MSYKIQFVPSALKEWDKLGAEIKSQFKKKLKERIKNPFVPKDCIGKNLYKIKLKAAGYRLIYEVDQKIITLLILGIGKRNRNEVYNKVLKNK